MSPKLLWIDDKRNATRKKQQQDVAFASFPAITPNLSNAVQRATTDPTRLQTSDLMALQQSVGNRAVAQLLQRQTRPLPRSTPSQSRLTVGPADDAHERQADQVARQVVQGQTATIQRTPQSRSGIIQRQMLDPAYEDEIFELEHAKRQARLQDNMGKDGKRRTIAKDDPRKAMLNEHLHSKRERQQLRDPRYTAALDAIRFRSSDTSGLPEMAADDPRKSMLNEHLHSKRERQQLRDPRYTAALDAIRFRSSDTSGLPEMAADDPRKSMLNKHLHSKRERQQLRDPRYIAALDAIRFRSSDTSSLPEIAKEDPRKSMLNKHLHSKREHQQLRDPRYIAFMDALGRSAANTSSATAVGEDMSLGAQINRQRRKMMLNKHLHNKRDDQQARDPMYKATLHAINHRSSDTSALAGHEMVSKQKPIHDKIKNQNLLPGDKPIDMTQPKETRYDPLKKKLPHSLRKTIEFGYATTTKESESKPGIVDQFGDNPEATSYLSTATSDTNKRLLSQPTAKGRLRQLTTPTEFTSMKSLADTEATWPSATLRGGPTGAHQFVEHGAHNGPLYMILNAIHAINSPVPGATSPPKSGWYNNEVEQTAVHYAQTKIDNEIATLAGGNTGGPDSINFKGPGWAAAQSVVNENNTFPNVNDRWTGPGGIRPTSIAEYVGSSHLFINNTTFRWYNPDGSVGGTRTVGKLFNTHINELRPTMADAGITSVPSLAALKIKVQLLAATPASANLPALTEPDVEFALNKEYRHTVAGVPMVVKLTEYDPNYVSNQYIAVFRMTQQPAAKYVVYTAYPR